MTYNEFMQKDLALLAMITHYKQDNEDARVRIAQNDREVHALEQQRKQLLCEYAKSDNVCGYGDPFTRQRNLHGDLVS